MTDTARGTVTRYAKDGGGAAEVLARGQRAPSEIAVADGVGAAQFTNVRFRRGGYRGQPERVPLACRALGEAVHLRGDPAPATRFQRTEPRLADKLQRTIRFDHPYRHCHRADRRQGLLEYRRRDLRTVIGQLHGSFHDTQTR